MLDLTNGWALINGASHSLRAVPKSTFRARSLAIHETGPDLDDLSVPSTLTRTPNVVFLDAATGSFLSAPAFSDR